MAIAKGRTNMQALIEDEAYVIEGLLTEIELFFEKNMSSARQRMNNDISKEDDDLVVKDIKSDYYAIESIYSNYSQSFIGLMVVKIYAYAESMLEELMQTKRYTAKKKVKDDISDIEKFFKVICTERNISFQLLDIWEDFACFHDLRRSYAHNKGRKTEVHPTYDLLRTNIYQIRELLLSIERAPLNNTFVG